MGGGLIDFFLVPSCVYGLMLYTRFTAAECECVCEGVCVCVWGGVLLYQPHSSWTDIEISRILQITTLRNHVHAIYRKKFWL